MLARILKGSLQEYLDFDAGVIAESCIERETQIGTVPVLPDSGQISTGISELHAARRKEGRTTARSRKTDRGLSAGSPMRTYLGQKAVSFMISGSSLPFRKRIGRSG